MAYFKTNRDEEIERLAMMLRKNRLASSDSEARRMAAEMLETSKKVAEDFSEKEKQIYGEQRKDPEIELAHKHVEQLAANLAKGRGEVRINLEGVDLNKPLKELVAEEESHEEPDEDDAVELVEEPVEGIESSKSVDEPIPEEKYAPEEAAESSEPVEIEERVEVHIPEELEVERIDTSEDYSEGEDADRGSGDEAPVDDFPIHESEPEGAEQRESKDEAVPSESVEQSGESFDEGSSFEGESKDFDEEAAGDEELDFSVKELDTKEQLQKSEEERRKEREKMPESKVDLSKMFDVNK